MNTSPHETEVLVAGGGPTGLMLALGLASRGVACRVVDRAPVRSVRSRALVVHARSLELLQKLGIADELIAAGRRTMAANVFINGRPALRFAFGDVGKVTDTPFPFALLVSQVDTERVLEARLASLGTQVERPLELTGFARDADGVSARLRHGDGHEEVIRARYIVGCDGAHSVVRKGAGLTFEGAPYPQDFVLADVSVDWENDDGGLYIFVSRAGLLAAFSFAEPGSYRLIATRPDGVPDDAGDPTLDEFREIVRQTSPASMKLRDPRWLARFRLHHRAAKLALVLHGHAPDVFLDSYEAERLPVGRRLLRTTDRLFAGTASRGRISLALAGFLLPRLGRFALGRPGLAARGFRFISQLEIAYPSSPVVAEARPRFHGGRGAGHRAPDANVRCSGSEPTLFSLCSGAAHHLLVFGGDGNKALQTLAAEHLGDVHAHHITRTVSAADAWIDESGEAHRRYAVTDTGYYLIRPDGHVAFRASGLGAEPFARYLTRLLPS